MNIKNIVSETKKRSNIMNGITIDWQYAKPLLLDVFAEADHSTVAYQEKADSLFYLLSAIEDSVVELKSFIPEVKK